MHLSSVVFPAPLLPRTAAHWPSSMAKLTSRRISGPEGLYLKHLADLIQAVEGGKINQANAKKVFAKILEDDVEPLAYMEKEGLLMVSDSGAIEGAVDQVLAENPKTVEEFHSGKEKVLGFLVGQVMKKMRGKADPGMVNELLRKKL